MDLAEIRKKITEIDESIIKLLGERFHLIPFLVEEKRTQNIAVFQPEREKQLYQKYWGLALQEKLNPEMIRQIFHIIIKEMRILQEDLLND